jgi:hypothetical protein
VESHRRPRRRPTAENKKRSAKTDEGGGNKTNRVYTPELVERLEVRFEGGGEREQGQGRERKHVTGLKHKSVIIVPQ